MSERFELEFSNDALLSRALLLISDNKINIFIEDQNKEYEYEEIFEKLFSKEVEISCIFPTGGKPNLEEAFRLFSNPNEYGKTFFIADGDFDLALNKKMTKADNFVYLKRYNIESYFLNEDAIYKFMRIRMRKTLAETRRIIDYRQWTSTVTPFFKELFVIHCLVQKYAPTVKNVARGPYSFINCYGMPDFDALQCYKNEVKKIIPNYNTSFEKMHSKLKATYGDSTGCYECGKYYIFSLKKFLETFVRRSIKEEDLRAALISMIDISQLDYVKEQLYSYMLRTS